MKAQLLDAQVETLGGMPRRGPVRLVRSAAPGIIDGYRPLPGTVLLAKVDSSTFCAGGAKGQVGCEAFDQMAGDLKA